MILSRRGFCAVGLAVLAGPALGQPMIIDDFTGDAAARWRFFTDQVMGGVSTGAATISQDGGVPHLHLTGEVSTANRGGFIQARRDLGTAIPAATEALTVRVRGNGLRYFLHLRTAYTALPWQFYQAPFLVSDAWQDIDLPLADFRPKGRGLTAALKPEDITSIAVAAYGRDHAVDLEISALAATEKQ